MRIEFTQPQRADETWSSGTLIIGSGADCDIVLEAPGVATRHVTLHADARGLVLEVTAGAGRVYVNARPVRERALLRAGDTIGLGEAQLRLCADPLEMGDETPTPGRRPASISVRALSGPLSGRVWSVGDDGSSLGAGGSLPLELPEAAAAELHIRWRDGGLWLDSVSPERCPVRVNGRVSSSARLVHGDQIGIGAHRFVIDAAGLDPAAQTSVSKSLPAEPEAAAGPRGEVWWLIMTAAALALLIALILLIRL